jgi:hypothetical protein
LTPREPAHLLEPLDWDQRGERLALALDESGLRDQSRPIANKRLRRGLVTCASGFNRTF